MSIHKAVTNTIKKSASLWRLVTVSSFLLSDFKQWCHMEEQ